MPSSRRRSSRPPPSRSDGTPGFQAPDEQTLDGAKDLVIERALEWQREATDCRCGECNARVGRRPTEVSLSIAIDAYRARVAKRKFETEAPTVPRKRRGI
jgi:hypothetical protein